MKMNRNLGEFANLVLELHYENKPPERIIEIVKRQENYELSIANINEILSLHEKGDFE